MALAIYLKLAGIDGESTATGHEHQIDVLSFSFGLTHGSDTGVPSFSGVTVVKNADIASPNLMLACAIGTHIATARLSCEIITDGPINVPLAVWDFTNVMLTSFQDAGNNGGEDRPVEQISFTFRTIAYSISEVDSQGDTGKTVRAGFNLDTDRPF
jgi:type VI secretion system secreted protein Hcp